MEHFLRTSFLTCTWFMNYKIWYSSFLWQNVFRSKTIYPNILLITIELNRNEKHSSSKSLFIWKWCWLSSHLIVRSNDLNSMVFVWTPICYYEWMKLWSFRETRVGPRLYWLNKSLKNFHKLNFIDWLILRTTFEPIHTCIDPNPHAVILCASPISYRGVISFGKYEYPSRISASQPYISPTSRGI